MNWGKKSILLAGSFTFLVGIIIIMSVQGIRVTREFHDLFRQTYEEPIAEIVTLEQARANLIAVHRGMKDVVLARTPQQLASALADVDHYERQIHQNLLDLRRLHTENDAAEEIIAAHDALLTIGTQVTVLARQGQYEQAAEITRTAEADQVALIASLMDERISDKRAEVAAANDAVRKLAADGGRQIALAAPLQILAAIFISIVTYRTLMLYEQRLYQEKEELQTSQDQLMRSEEHYRMLFEQMNSGAAVYQVREDGGSGVDYTVLEINRTGESLAGLAREKILGRHLGELQPQIDGCGLIPVFRQVWLSGRPAGFISNETSASGENRWYDYRISRLSSGEVVAIYEDVTERTNLYERLRQSEETYRLLVEHQNDLVVKIDRNGCYLYVSPSFCRLMGRSEADLLGTSFLATVYPPDIPLSNQAMAALGQPPYIYQFEERLVTAQGIRWIEWDSSAVIDEQGQVTAIIDSGRDITERKKHQEEIVYLNYHDVLTGLYNRKFFEEESHRLDTKRQLPISVIWGDINGLKLINDGFGHQQGDRVLAEIARILRRCCREDDIIARIGGDEFCILLPQTGCETVQEICRRIQRECEQCRQSSIEEWIYPSISLGYGTKTAAEENMDTILKSAESFMYRRKLLESKSMISSIISSIKTTMVEKSHETEAHAERLVWLSKAMGSQLVLPEEQMNELALFATLHDIGKIGVDDRILKKSSRLNETEWIEMKKHPEVGYRIAMASPELVPIARYILCHHEHWDGSGYPQGLRGKEIPLLARILIIVDAFDAMTQDRPYRRAIPWQAALAEINLHAGSQFDPELARIFVEMVLIQAANQPAAG